MHRPWVLLCFFALPMPAVAASEAAFPGLRTQAFDSGCFEPGTVQFDPALAQASDEFVDIPEHPAGGYRKIMVGQIDRTRATRYTITYDDGPSCDPSFNIWIEGTEQPIGDFLGDHLIVPGNGFLYVIRRSNRSFESREKWAIRNGELVEVPQSHYYVGLETRTLKAIALHQSADAKSPLIAKVPAATMVTVVVNQEVDGRDWYLVRTPFGLVGWIEDNGYGDGRQFEAIEFRGD